MYTRADFGNELKERVAKKQNSAEIAEWAYSVFLEHIGPILRFVPPGATCG